MQKVEWIAAVILSTVILFTSCSNDDDCQGGMIAISDIQDLGCNNAAFTLSVSSISEFELIRSQEDFDSRIDIICSPNIDWINFDLIAGMVPLTNGLTSIEKQLNMNCSINQLILSIVITTNIAQNAPIISFNAIIPKLQDDQDVFVEIEIVSP